MVLVLFEYKLSQFQPVKDAIATRVIINRNRIQFDFFILSPLRKVQCPRPPKRGSSQLTELQSIEKFIYAINIVIYTFRSGLNLVFHKQLFLLQSSSFFAYDTTGVCAKTPYRV
jgi:hypothetical protein